ncbi:MAG: hypothetical protein QGG40_17190 [Myxococcota bacterium]|jgi:hypothetical protein|nr:hypothetical protein [Myxococcota bacterium]
MRLLACLAVLFIAACRADEPQLSGVAEELGIDESASISSPEEVSDEQGEPKSADRNAVYTKPADVYVDVRHFGGRAYRASRDELALQLGPLQESTVIPNGDGQELTFERGLIRVLDDRIYMLRVALQEPMRRTQAMQALGFPAQSGRYLTLHREYRLNHEWSFRRIRLRREDRDSEYVNQVEAWRWVPGESGTRR